MNIAQHVERGGRDFAERPALIFEGQSFTYAGLDELAGRSARLLAELGISQGDRVALFLPNIPEFVIAYLAIQKLGGIAVSVNARLRRDEVGFVLADSGAKAIITTRELREQVPVEALTVPGYVFIAEGEVGDDLPWQALRERVAVGMAAAYLDPDTPAAIVYTSGTTGTPKGATLSHSNVVFTAQSKQRYLKLRPEDRLLLFLPLFHCFGQNAILNAGLQAGATVVLQRRFDLETAVRAVQEEAISVFCAIPGIFLMLLDKVDPVLLHPVRYWMSAAANLPLEIETRWQEAIGVPIHQGYGLTETSPFASYNHLEHYKPGSIGTPIDQVQMKVVDVESGRDLDDFAPGEILIRGPNVMLGYWNRPAETAEALRGGWFHSGDIGYQDDQGYFFLVDRLKDMINVGGLKVYPAEVENVLYRHPGVAECAVFGAPDPLLGERVKAHIVPKPDNTATPEEIIAFCRSQIADYKTPSVVEFVAGIPKNPTGKILKRVLQEAERQRNGSEAVPGEPAPIAAAAASSRLPIPDEEAVEAWLATWLAGQLDCVAAAIDRERPFAAYGVTSLQAVRMIAELGAWLGMPLSAVLAWSHPTVHELARHVTGSGASRSDPPPEPDAPAAAAQPGEEPDLDALSDAELAHLLAAEIEASRQGRMP